MIHGQGITPNIVVPLSEDEEIAIHWLQLPGGADNLELALKAFPPDRQQSCGTLVQEHRDGQLERCPRYACRGSRCTTQGTDAAPEKGVCGSPPVVN